VLINIPDCGIVVEDPILRGVPSSESYNKYYSRFHYSRYYYRRRNYNTPPPLYTFTPAHVTQLLNTVENKIYINILEPVSYRVIWTSASEADFIEPQYLQYIVHPEIKKMLVKSPLKKRRHLVSHLHRS